MDAERTAEAADHHEEVHELAVRGEQLAELVDHHEQAGQRGQFGAGRAGALVLQGGRVVAGRAQQLLPAHQLAVQRVLHALHEGGLVGEVGDDRGGVRELLQTEEGGAALEVDEDEVEGLGGVAQRQAQDQGAQEFALAGAGGADEQAVRSHAALRGLLDVELHGTAVDADGHRDPQPGGTGLPGEVGPGVVPVEVGYAEQRGQLDVRLQRLGDVGAQADPAGGEQPRQGLGAQRAEPVGAAQRHRPLLAAAVGAHQADRVGSHRQAQGVAARTPAQGSRHVQDQRVAVAVTGPAVALRHGDAVQDDDGEGLVTAGPGVRVEAGTLGELAAQQVVQFGEVRGDAADRSGAVLLVRVQDVRQPLHPLPVGTPVVTGADGEPQFLGGVEDGELRDHGTHQGRQRLVGGTGRPRRPAARRPARAVQGLSRRGVPGGGVLLDGVLGAQQDAGRGAQIEAEGLLGDGRVGADEAAQSVRAQGFQVLDRPGRDRVEGEGELLLAHRDADLAEVLVGRPAFPQP